MQWFWILPSLGYGVYLYATTGQAYGLIFGAMSLISMAGSQFLQRRNRPVDVQKPVWFGENRVAIGERVLPRGEWRWKPDWTDRVYEAFENEVAQSNSRATIEAKLNGPLQATNANPTGLSAWLGFESSKSVELDLTAEGYHGLVIGPTGSGKSQLLTTWLVSLCAQYDSSRLNLALIDFKGGACLGPFASQPQTIAFATDLDGQAPALFANLAAELERRSRLLADASVGRIADLRVEMQPPNLLVVVDEAQPALAQPPIAAVVENIASRGRSLGVHVILTGQSLSGISRNIVGNLGARILVGKPDAVEMAQLGMNRADSSKWESEANWSQATLATQNRQVRFRFASAGKVSVAKISAHLMAQQTLFPQQKQQIASELVVKPANVFEFGSVS